MRALIIKLRFLRALTLGPPVSQWSSDIPTMHNNEWHWERLLPDGSYEYRELTEQEKYEYWESQQW